jgi:hypothetical protein
MSLNNGRWEASYRDPAGREKIKRHRTRAEADRWLAAMKTNIARGDYIDPKLAKTPFRRWSDEWLATTSHLRARTRGGYESALRIHVVPVFGDMPVGAIQQADVGS